MKNGTDNHLTPERQNRRMAGAWLRQRREQLGLTQRELADRAGYRYHAFMSQLEAGSIRLPSQDLERWARALQIEDKKLAELYLAFYEPELFKFIVRKSRDMYLDSL